MYIFSARALASCRRRPLSSNVRRHKIRGVLLIMKSRLCIKTSTFAFACVCLFCPIADATEVSAELLWSGIYSTERDRFVEDSQSVTGKRILSQGARLELETTRIPARIGTRFGIGFVFHGDAGTVIAHQRVVRTPAVTNPATNKSMTGSTIDRSAPVNTPLFSGYVFEYDWGLVPGVYIFEIWSGGKKLVSQEFTVSTP